MRCASLYLYPLLLVTMLAETDCSKAKDRSAIYPAGEKAVVGPLTYNVLDTELLPQLGDDPIKARNPVNRFYLVRIAVSNGGATEVPIPALTLVDDAGQTYAELADGAGVPNWLGVIRKVGVAQTEQGNVVFDAPPKHYRLRLTDEIDEKEISIDMPLSLGREKALQAPASLAPDGSRIPDR